MKISRRGGRLRLRLERVEVEVLTSLFDELDAVLAIDAADDGPHDADVDAVLERLFPAGYADESAAAEFRDLTRAGLHTERSDRIGTCRADLATSGDIDLTDPDAATRWIQTLNDLRLALGTRLGIEADDDHDLDPSDQPRFVYSWLTAVQDGVVTALMG